MSGKPLDFEAAMAKFESAREALTSFRHRNVRLIEEHDLLITAHNEALKDVKALYKKHHDVLGPREGEFKISVKTSVDVKLLVKLLGPVVDPIVEWEPHLNRKEYDEAVRAGIIPSDVVEKVETRDTFAVSGPKEQ